MQHVAAMALWLKALLWVAVLVLPGGLLLAPVLLAVHHKERLARAEADDASDAIVTSHPA